MSTIKSILNAEYVSWVDTQAVTVTIYATSGGPASGTSVSIATASQLYNEKTGAIDTTQDGKPLRRPPKGVVSVPPCRQKENGCPKGTPENPKSLTRQNQKAYAHYLRCKATGQFPDDSIVKYHAGLIREVEEYVEEARHDHLEKLLEAVLTRTI